MRVDLTENDLLDLELRARKGAEDLAKDMAELLAYCRVLMDGVEDEDEAYRRGYDDGYDDAVEFMRQQGWQGA